MKDEQNNVYFRTTFHSYFLPDVPENTDSLVELEQKWTTFSFRLLRTGWSDEDKTERDAYFWVKNLCKTFAVYLGTDEDGFDLYDEDVQRKSCSFRSNGNVLEIRNIGSLRTFSLSVDEGESKRLQKSVEDIVRSLQAKKMLE
jgi:hypothetical protein